MVNNTLTRVTLTPRRLAVAAVALSAVVTWVLGRPPSEVERLRRNFADVQRQVRAANESKGARAGDRGRILRLRAQARAANGAQREAYESEAAVIERRLGWNDRSDVRAAVLSAPLVSFSRAELPTDVVPVSSADGNGCVACHTAIASPGYESYPRPFRTHPALASYVGSGSPHPPSRVECGACHRGNGHASTFSEAGHSTIRTDGRQAPPSGRTWNDPTAPGSMLPLGRVEAACANCHAGERYQPGATALNEAYTTLERGGCYACHDVAGMERTAKRGPDLRRIGAKLSPEWVKAWLANPRAVKPATWMPRFWSGDTPSAEEAAAIEAVAAYLFATSEPYAPAAADPLRGDAARGKALVEAVGCLGCHVIGDTSRDETSVRRSFGQPLQAVGGKTTYAWLFDWLREPSRYSPGTRMPNLRLSVQEAADAATYLTTLVREPAAPQFIGPQDDDTYRAVIQRYAEPGAREISDASQLSGEPLRVMAGRAVVGALRCFNCHEIRGFEVRSPAVPMAPRAVWLDADARGVHRSAGASRGGTEAGADFGFGPAEAARLALALTAVAGRPGRDMHGIGTPWHLVKAAGRTLAHERNCVGCHALEGAGGDFVSLVAEPTIGPPLLTPEGSRVQPGWLRAFLHEPTTIRPWLSVRMPTFDLSQDQTERIGAYLRAVAPANPEPGPTQADVTAAAGKDLFELLKCQQCHVLGTIPPDQPTSNLAPDLRMARERLQPEWVLAWLRAPSAILPGTRMPTFWPDYPASFYPPLGKDGAKQVRAIRDHLLTLR